MSTPVVADETSLRARIPFKDGRLAELLRLDVRPEPSLARARDLVAAVFPELQGDPAAWLTDAAPAEPARWSDERVRVRYVGHACLLVQSAGHSILVDPLIPQGTRPDGVFGLDSLPEWIDLVVVTHAHPDHFDLETLLRLRPRVGRVAVPRSRGALIGDVSLKRILGELGYADVIELDSGDRLAVGSGELVALPFLGEHGDLLHGSKAIYWIRFGSTTLLAAADSACLDERTYARARDIVGSIQNVFMNTEVDGAPISWPFDALFPKKRDRKLESTRKCRGSNVAEGLRMLETVGASGLYVYAMGLEPWVQRITGPASSEESPRMAACRELITRAEERGVRACRLAGAQDLVLG
jgi:L-ascorbate metabolism protein UlaG (beta-lactamase superfamily)